MLLEFETALDAWKVAEHLYDVQVQDNWLIFEKDLDDEAVGLAIELAKVEKCDEFLRFCMLRFVEPPYNEDKPLIVVADKEYRRHQTTIDATQDPEEIERQIQYMLEFSPSIAHENDPNYKPEWEILGSLNFGLVNLDLSASLKRISLIANLVKNMSFFQTAELQCKFRNTWDALESYFDSFGKEADIDKFDLHYEGRFRNPRDFVYHRTAKNQDVKFLMEGFEAPESGDIWGAIASHWQNNKFHFCTAHNGDVDVFAINP